MTSHLLALLLVTQAPSSQPAPSLDFDLLGNAPASEPLVDARAIAARRLMLQMHQAAGITMFVLLLSTTILGQLNYADRFMGCGDTGRFELAHAVVAYTGFGTFVGTGVLALFAPTPFRDPSAGPDRMTLHRVGMYGAALAMLAQIILGIVTRQQEGFTVQRDLAAAHLALGYATLGLSAIGVGAVVF